MRRKILRLYEETQNIASLRGDAKYCVPIGLFYDTDISFEKDNLTVNKFY